MPIPEFLPWFLFTRFDFLLLFCFCKRFESTKITSYSQHCKNLKKYNLRKSPRFPILIGLNQCFFLNFVFQSGHWALLGLRIENKFEKKTRFQNYIFVISGILLHSLSIVFDAPLQYACLTSLGTCIKNCSLVKQ